MAQSRTRTGRFRPLNRDSAPHLFQCLLNLIRSVVQTRVARVLAWWWKVQLGPECTFYGLPLFRRLPDSGIRIGARSKFLSARWANMVGINRPCILSTLREAARIEIGSDCGFSGTIIGCASKITIGDRVLCGANVTITDTDWHPIDWRDRISDKHSDTAPIFIDDDVWLGMNVTVLKGVKIGRGTVVGAGSIVLRSLPAGVIAAGQPAVVVRHLPAQQASDREYTSVAVEEHINNG